MIFRRVAVCALVLSLSLVARRAEAFCGFYVSGADAKLFNNATMVVMMREGTRTVLSMQNNYQGPPSDFAMVVPVPVVLKEENVKTLPRAIFDRVDKLSAPRLVEYWERDPCKPVFPARPAAAGAGFGVGRGAGRARALKKAEVKIEAQFSVGEYEVVVLSASDSGALDKWLRDNNYKIPAGAEPHLEPYVQQGMKFFVAKVDPKKVTFKDGMATLSPLRFHYDAETFSLPIRLGLINSSGTQDLIVNILAKDRRYQTANYENAFIPTNLDVDEKARDGFGEFYAALFDEAIGPKKNRVVTEYSWSARSCDPCPDTPLREQELLTLGADVLGDAKGGKSKPAAKVRATSPTVIGRLDRGVVRRVVRQKMEAFRTCYASALDRQPKLSGRIVARFDVDAKGKVSNVSRGGMVADAPLAKCITDAFRGMTFPNSTGEKVTVEQPLILGDLRRRGRRLGRNFVLTRLHARYSKDGLSEDLVFQEAEAVSGGRERRRGGVLEQGATRDRINNFQARYAIRHPWKGAIECDNPRRGIWGPPPASELGTKPPTRAAQNLAFAPRGKVKAASFVMGGAVPAAQTKPADKSTKPVVRPAPSAAPSASPSASPSAAPSASTDADPPPASEGCGCALPGRAPRHRAGLLALLGAAWLARRRRRRLD